MNYLLYFVLGTFVSLCVPLYATDDDNVQKFSACGRNQFLELVDGSSRCHPCPEGTYINETGHNLTSCRSVLEINNPETVWGFLANEINPFLFIGVLSCALAFIVVYTYHCWYKKIPRNREVCKRIADVENGHNSECLVQNEFIIIRENERKSLALAQKVIHLFKKVWSSNKIKRQTGNLETVSYSKV
ncbi:hypothetical protein Btru_042976 [Bulinus truncatus]|nr:hypothetical protein Btru_042976 [Bulinus truncatus]